jgi:hypothetical protein
MKESSRRIAFREFGDQNSEKILLCIPGILEGQNSFDELVNFVEQHEGCRLITVDLAFPQFSRHLIMSKLNWRESHEENEIYV